MIKFQSFWKSYREEVISDEAPPVQLRSCKTAFYSGALSMFAALVEMPNHISDDEGADYVERIREEIQKELESIARGEGKH